MEEVIESIKFINEKFEEMETDRKEEESQISELKNEVKTLNEKAEQMNRSLDRHEQYSRRNFLYSWCERKREDTPKVVIEIFEREIQKKKSIIDTDRPHRLGKMHTGSRH